ncbi:DNA sulfur modification protein DndB [Amycolatopsis sp. NPDC050768]|uniref:DNA sulfur modification protein DndB n=1 Tax=Amycolatopsis sp. NPDC050768 TaxID=3154839 RepID=UPI003411CC08
MSDVSAPLTFDADALKRAGVPVGIKFEKLALIGQAGDTKKATFTVTFEELARIFTFDRLLTRHDYDIDDPNTPGNRDIIDNHVKRILSGLRLMENPHLGTVTVALPAEHAKIKNIQKISKYAALGVLTVHTDAPNPVVLDGQHRIETSHRLWNMIQDSTDEDDIAIRERLEKTSVEVTLMLASDADALSTIFVRMGSTRPISASLIAVMDKSNFQNRFGQYVMRHSDLFSDRTTYLSATAQKRISERRGRTFDGLYPAAAVRSAAASLAGVGVRDRTPDQREGLIKQFIEAKATKERISEATALSQLGDEVAALLNYAYTVIPGWREMSRKKITAAEFKKEFVHSSAAGLHVIANVICAARAAKVNAHLAIDALAELPWRSDALRAGKSETGEEIQVHEFFEGALVSTSFDVKSGEWRTGTAGATRSTYETAIDKVLRHISLTTPSLKPIASEATYKAIGLIGRQSGPGRPRKAA